MLVFDKFKIRDALTEENIFELLHEWGGDPVPAPFGYVSATICHNPPGEGSRKLYYYSNTGLFKCYTGCNAYFDIFELTIKVFSIQNKKEIDLSKKMGEGVIFTTVHKSKGLEYPVCYFADLDHEFNMSDIKDKFIVDRKYGLIVPSMMEENDTTIIKELYKHNYSKEEISEKIRSFLLSCLLLVNYGFSINPSAVPLSVHCL